MTIDERAEGRLQCGDVIAGKYRVEREIGRGGMGVVVAATHMELEQRVAIKILQQSAAYDQTAIVRFLREARAAAKIRSEHVARVVDVGKLEDGSSYIVMEYLDGADLAEVLKREGPLRPTIAADYILQACEGIAGAHAAGIIHRDIKPANLFLARQPGRKNVVKILDFGVSKISNASMNSNNGSSTQTGQVLGSPLYMSPEQLDSTVSVDGRTDIWALGVVLFELVAGTPPFGGKSSANIMTAILRDPAPKLRTLRPDAPAALEEVLARCLEKDRELRYATVIDLAEAIAPFCGKGADDAVNRIYQILADAANHDPNATPAPERAPKDSADEHPSGDKSDPRRSEPRSQSAQRSLVGSSRTHDERYLRSKRNLVVTGFVGVVALSVGGIFLRPRSSANTPLTPASAEVTTEPVMTTVSAPASVTAPSAIPSAMPTTSEVTITFTGAPADTKVFRGDVNLGTTSTPLRLARSTDKIVLRFVADSFAPAELELTPSADQTLSITLKPAKRPVTTPTKRQVPKELEGF